MKRDHLSLATGFLPGLSLLIVLLCRRYVQSGTGMPGWAIEIGVAWLWVMVEVVVFLLPTLILMFLCSRKKESVLDWGLKKLPVRAVPMLLTLAIAMAIVNLLLGDLIAGVTGHAYSEIHVFAPLLAQQPSIAVLILAVVIVPVFGGQLLFGRGMMSVYSSCGGLFAIIVSALCYSLLTGTPETLPGTFLSMLSFIYISWALNSVWASVLAHATYSVIHLLLLFVAGAYSGQELWSIVRLVMVFLFGLFLYLSMYSMEQLMEKGALRRLDRVRRERLINNIVFSPGLWMTVFLFIIQWIT